MTHRYRDFPVAPLLEHLARQHPNRTGPVSALCKTCGISGDTAHRWIDEGLAELEADRVAVRLGLHPSALWPDHWWAVHDADQAVVRYQLRERRWVVNWVRRHRFDPCSPPRLPSVAAAGSDRVTLPRPVRPHLLHPTTERQENPMPKTPKPLNKKQRDRADRALHTEAVRLQAQADAARAKRDGHIAALLRDGVAEFVCVNETGVPRGVVQRGRAECAMSVAVEVARTLPCFLGADVADVVKSFPPWGLVCSLSAGERTVISFAIAAERLLENCDAETVDAVLDALNRVRAGMVR